MFKRRIFLYTVLVLLFIGVGIGTGYFIAAFFDLPQIEKLENYQPSVITRVYSEDGEIIGEFFRERREIVPLSEIPQYLQNAFIAIEDLSTPWNRLETHLHGCLGELNHLEFHRRGS